MIAGALLFFFSPAFSKESAGTSAFGAGLENLLGALIKSFAGATSPLKLIPDTEFIIDMGNLLYNTLR